MVDDLPLDLDGTRVPVRHHIQKSVRINIQAIRGVAKELIPGPHPIDGARCGAGLHRRGPRHEGIGQVPGPTAPGQTRVSRTHARQLSCPPYVLRRVGRACSGQLPPSGSRLGWETLARTNRSGQTA